MKKVLVITALLNENKIGLLKEFIASGLKESSVTIFVYQKKNEQNLLSFIGKNRPPMIILDGRTNYISLNILHEIIENIIGVYDIYSKIYAIKEFVNLRGVNNIEIKEVPKILESL